MSSSKKIYLNRDFAAGVYQILYSVQYTHVNCIVYIRGGGVGSGPQTDKDLPLSPYTG
jgi:hypothetical protein